MKVLSQDDPELLKRSFSVVPHLTTTSVGRILEIHGSIDSTNSRAKEISRGGGVHGVAVVALEQTAGRGQRGRRWHSPRGAGLYCSFLLRPTLSPRLSPTLPIIAGVALNGALQEFVEPRLGLKWPNDVLVKGWPHFGKKVAGILVEASADSFRIDHAIVGIGINLFETERPEEIRETAISLSGLGGTEIDPPRVLGSVANHLEARLEEAQSGDLDRVIDAWNQNAMGIGEDVRVRVDGEQLIGRLQGVGESGALRLLSADGAKELYRGELVLKDVPKGKEIQTD